MPIFVLRFRLLEEESGGYFLQPLIPLPEQEMSPAKSEVLSETGVNVKGMGHIHSHEDIKPVSVVLEDCAKENVEGFDNSKLLFRGHQSSEKISRPPSKPLESPLPKFRSPPCELSSPPCKRSRVESEAHGLPAKLESSSTAESENSEDITEDTEVRALSLC